MQDDLDTRFGRLREPERIDKWEDRAPDSRCRLDSAVAAVLRTLAQCAGAPLLMASARTTNYLWVIDEAGSTIMAVEEIALRPPEAPRSGYPRRRGFQHLSEERKLGHPTLVDGRPVRIAGEIALDDTTDGLKWVLNANSGRYCRQAPPAKRQIEAAADQFRSLGLDVEIDYL